MQMSNLSESSERPVQGAASGSYEIGNAVYEISRVFGENRTLKDILLERITSEKNALFN